MRKIDVLHVDRKSAMYASIATIVIVPVIMLISYATVPDTDPMFKSMTPVVGIVYTPIVFFPAWGIIYAVLRHRACKRADL